MLRRLVQILLLALFVLLLYLASWPPPEIGVTNTFLRMDPLLSLQAMLAGRVWIGAAVFGLALLGATLVLGRFFCGWMCPFGTLLELGDDLFIGRKTKRKWPAHARKLRHVKYGILLLIFAAALFGVGLAYWFDPLTWATRLFTYAVWPVAALIGNGLLDLLRPVFEELGWFSLARMEVSQPVFGWVGVLAVALLAGLIWLGRYQRRFWCRHLCPLGALLAIPARFSLFKRVVGPSCDKDGKCRRVCETGAIHEAKMTYDAGECIQCGRCVSDCHLNVTRFSPVVFHEQKQSGTDLSRRQAVGWMAAGAVGAAWLVANPDRAFARDDALRPPGALPEDEFLETCVRCGQCSKVCPTHCLQAAGLETGLVGVMSPVAKMRLGPCDPNCNACGLVCPTGAIQPFELLRKPKLKIGNAVLDPHRCVVWEQGKVCLVCDENCPYGAIHWEQTQEGHRRPVVDETVCNGCGQCEHACPVDGVAAIRVHPAGRTQAHLS